jgi:hypothetical protein
MGELLSFKMWGNSGSDVTSAGPDVNAGSGAVEFLSNLEAEIWGLRSEI